MTKRIFRSITLVAAVVLLASFIVTLGVLSEYFGGVQKELLHDELGLAAAAVETDGTEYLERAKSANYRLTWIDSDGTVIYDSQADAASMQNHLGREEVDSALRTGVGESTRYSSTLLEKTTYYAKRLSDSTVLRISASRHGGRARAGHAAADARCAGRGDNNRAAARKARGGAYSRSAQ